MSTMINNDMTLEEKLAAIDKAMKEMQASTQKTNIDSAPIDPADALACEGCQ